MQSINKNINNATTPTATHVKVNFNNEFRRFALETVSFAHLQRTLLTLYSLDDSTVLKVKFQDDENDWVVLSSDEELSYAIEFGLPLRLTFQVVEGINAATETVSEPEFSPSPSPSPVPVSVPVRGGRGRGRGKAFAGAGVSVQDRLNAKSSRLTERIQALENRLDENPSLPSERQRVLRWRLVQLQNKLSAVQEKKASLDSVVGGATPNPTPVSTPSDAHFNAEEPHPHGFGRGRMGRGRGCGRGGARGRGGLKYGAVISQSNHPDIIAARDAFAKFRQCKVDLKVARKSGSPQAIESCEAALKEAIQLRKERLGNVLGSQRAQKRECAQNLKAAQRSGNREQIKACEEALAQAITELKQAKAEILNQ